MNFTNLRGPGIKQEGAPTEQQQDAQQQAPQFLPHPQGAPVWHQHPGGALPGPPLQQWQQQQQGPYAMPYQQQYQQLPAQPPHWAQAGPYAMHPPQPAPYPQPQPQQPPPPAQQQAWLFGAQAGPGMGPAPARQLGYEQQRALDLVQQGHCVFVTGGAGVGKSFTTQALVEQLLAQRRTVAVTASTGTAALNIDGMTVHSWAGILDVFEHPVVLAETLWDWRQWSDQWDSSDVLVLDEISMVDCDLIEKVDYLARYMRGWRIRRHRLFRGEEVHELHPLPFGGLQVVAVGDFYQLPPVPTKEKSSAQPTRRQKPAKVTLPQGTVPQKVPVIMAVLPPEAVDAHADALGERAAQHSQAALDFEYQQHYGPPLPQQQPYQQQQYRQQQGGFVAGPPPAAAAAAAAAAGGGFWGSAAAAVVAGSGSGGPMASPGGGLQPQTALQLLKGAGASPAAVRLQQQQQQQQQQCGGLAGAGAPAHAADVAAAGQPTGLQDQQQQQQRGQQQDQQQPWVGEDEEPSSPLLPTQPLFEDAEEQQGLAEQQQQQGGDSCGPPDAVQPPAKRRRLSEAERLQAQQQQGCTAGQETPVKAPAAADASPSQQQQQQQQPQQLEAAAAAAGAGAGPSAAATMSGRLSGSAGEEDLDWEAVDTAITQAETQTRSQQRQQQQQVPWLSPQQARQAASQQQQLQQQSPGPASLTSPQRPQQREHRAGSSAGASPMQPGSQAGRGGPGSSQAGRSKPRSALRALELLVQAPLPFADSFGTTQQRAAAVASGGAQAGGPSSSCAGAAGSPALSAGATAAAVVAAAAVALPPDTAGSSPAGGGADSAAAGVGGSKSSPAAAAAMKAAAATTAAEGEAAAAAASCEPAVEVVIIDSQDASAAAAAAGAGTDAEEAQPQATSGLDLQLDSPASSQGAAAAGAGQGGAAAEVIELLDSDSPPCSPVIDLTMTPVEHYDRPAAAAAATRPEAAVAASAAAAAGSSGLPSVQQMQQPSWAPGGVHPGSSWLSGRPLQLPRYQQQPFPQQQKQQQQQQQQPYFQQQQQPWPPRPPSNSPATAMRRLDLSGGSGGGPSGAGSGAFPGSGVPAAAAVATGVHSSSSSSTSRRQQYPELMRKLEAAANLPATPPASPRAAERRRAGAQGRGVSNEPRWFQDTHTRPSRDVCGVLLPRGLTRSRLFDVREMKLGHVYGRNNGRQVSVWWPGCLLHPDLPSGFNLRAQPEGGPAAAAAAAAAAGGYGGGGNEHLLYGYVPRLPVQFLKPMPAQAEYCFKSPVWAAAGFKPVVLRSVYRQADPELIGALNRLRLGQMDRATEMLLSELKRPLPDDGISATRLFPHNHDAKRLNEAEYARLGGPEHLFPAADRCEPDLYDKARMQDRLSSSTNAPVLLQLKEGTQVLLIFNINVRGGLANGTRGVVERIVSIRDYLKQEGVKILSEEAGSQAPQPPSSEPQHGPAGNGNQQPQMQQPQQQQGEQQQGEQQQQQGEQQPQPQQGAQHTSCGPLRFNAQPNLNPQSGRCSIRGCPCQQAPWSQIALDRATRAITALAKLPDSDRLETLELPSKPHQRDEVQRAIIWFNHTNLTGLPLCRFTVSAKHADASAAGDASGTGGAGGASAGTGPGVCYKRLIVGPREFKTKVSTQAHFRLQLSRMQVPLLHAWAITVHKSQGMSISKLVVTLGRAFAAGQVYVALSRCTSRDGLQIIGDVPAPITDSDVKRFYQYIFSLGPQ